MGTRRFGGEPLQERQGEGGSLAGAGGGLSQEVPAVEEGRDRLALDGGGFLVAEAGEGVDEGGGEAELGECLHGSKWWVGG